MADPWVGSLFEGWLLSADPRLSPTGGSASVTLTLLRQHLAGAPPFRSSGGVVAGPLHLPSAPSTALRADLLLVPDVPQRLHLGAAADGRPLALEVTLLRAASGR